MDYDRIFVAIIVGAFITWFAVIPVVFGGYLHDNDHFANSCAAKGGVVVDSYCIKHDVVIGVDK